VTSAIFEGYNRDTDEDCKPATPLIYTSIGLGAAVALGLTLPLVAPKSAVRPIAFLTAGLAISACALAVASQVLHLRGCVHDGGDSDYVHEFDGGGKMDLAKITLGTGGLFIVFHGVVCGLAAIFIVAEEMTKTDEVFHNEADTVAVPMPKLRVTV